MSRVVQLALLVTLATSLWVYLLKDEFSDRVHQLMIVMLLVFMRLLYKTSRNPGVTTTENEDPYGYGVKGTNYCEQCGATHPARTYCSPATKKCITRFDHHNPLLRVDVGLLNHLSYYSLLLWSSVWLFLIWFFTVKAFYNQHDPDLFLFKYIPTIPVLSEIITMVYMVVEVWARFTFFLYSCACLPVRYGYYENKDVPWFITTSEVTETQLFWGLYYVPMAISVVVAWYSMVGIFVFIAHAGILASSNMTIEEEVRAVSLPAIPEDRWRRLSSILVGLWTEVIAVMTTHRMYRLLHVYGEEAPAGYVVLDTSTGIRNAFGTIPTHLSKYDLGSVKENLLELWNCKRVEKPEPA
eukprot:TRINITY_DN6868_c3_g1_i1.p1 TRINITY_DN6868_c3_g1~~TRINITY_DN6868_c3_g1_i1.p1  ORF type:complete len:361 (+),score=31.14 TRINITY_DN6868_c3_g1_i1:23-1084(+)